eukprot:8973381-Pyramimonas_sp.AAC.1
MHSDFDRQIGNDIDGASDVGVESAVGSEIDSEIESGVDSCSEVHIDTGRRRRRCNRRSSLLSPSVISINAAAVAI